jgi:hypothetical protein
VSVKLTRRRDFVKANDSGSPLDNTPQRGKRVIPQDLNAGIPTISMLRLFQYSNAAQRPHRVHAFHSPNFIKTTIHHSIRQNRSENPISATQCSHVLKNTEMRKRKREKKGEKKVRNAPNVLLQLISCMFLSFPLFPSVFSSIFF